MSALNVEIQTASQSFLIEIRKECIRPGNICACLSEMGNELMGRRHDFDNVNELPLGNVTLISDADEVENVCGASGVR